MLLLAAMLPALAQEVDKLSAGTKVFLQRRANNLLEDTAVIKKSTFAKPQAIQGVEYVDCFISLNEGASISDLEDLGVEVNGVYDHFITARVPIGQIEAVSQLECVKQVSIARKLKPLTDEAKTVTNADKVWDGLNNGLPQEYDGTGVVLGIIDDGIEFNHLAFKDADGNTRVKAIYKPNDSSAGTGGVKTSIDGVELPGYAYTTATAIAAQTTDDTSASHGTHTTGCAAGSKVGNYSGMAPNVDLVLAGCGEDLTETALINSAKYIANYAKSVGKPCVISISIGGETGPHDGKSGTSIGYDEVAEKYGAVILLAAGNEADCTGYATKTLSSNSDAMAVIHTGTSYFNSNYSSSYGLVGACDIWNSTNEELKVTVKVLNSSGTAVYTSQAMSSGTISANTLSSYFSTSGSQGITIEGGVDANNNRYNINIWAQLGRNQGSYKVAYIITGKAGNVINVFTENNYSQLASSGSVSGYTLSAGLSDGTMCDDMTGSKTISVGAAATRLTVPTYYGSRTSQLSNGSYDEGDVAYFSSFGTDYNGVNHPFITAPGHSVVSSLNRHDTSGYISNSYGSYRVSLGSNTYDYWGWMSGTSMATPISAGVVALYLQADPTLDVDGVKDVIAHTATAYSNPASPAKQRGNGIINALAGIEYILNNTNTPRITATPASVAFGDQVAGGTYTQTFTVTGANLEGNITLAKSGSSAFSISPTSVAKATAEGDGATITVTFKPTAYTTADYTGTVTLTSSNATTVTVVLTGKGVYTAPVIAANPTSLTFTGNSGSTYTKTVTITGSNLQGNITAAIQNDANGYYSVSPTSFTASPQTVTVTWHPTAGGNSTANLVLTTTGTGANSVTVPLSGTAQGPTITANPTNVTFADAYATRTYTKTVTVTGTNLSQNITASISGANVYSIDKTSLGTSGGTITVTYAPTLAGTTSATLSLSSNGASTVTVPITGTAQAATPTLVVSPTALSFTADAEQQTTQTFNVTGRFISSDVALALSGANSTMFTVSPATIPAASISDNTPVTVTVTFTAPADDGTYTGTVTLTSNGAEAQTVALNAEVSTGGTASDAYLDIAKYATIDEAGWRTALVNNLYKYTEYSENGIAWLTLPTYGAFVGARYSTTSSTVGSGHPQAWIECSLGTNNTYAGTTWTSEASYTNPFNGSSAFFTSATARAIGYNSRTNTDVRTISYYVTNTTAVKLSGTGRNGTNATYPASLKVYECTKNGDNLIPSTTATKSLTNSSTTTFTLTADDLEASKIYKVETSIYRGYMYEIAFQTPLNKPSLSVTPSELSIKAAPGETATATFNVKGRLLTDNVAVTLTDQNGVFAVNPTNISISDAQAGSDVTVSFSSETEGTFTGTVTVVSGNLSETISLIGVSADGGTASDNYLNIAKYATINAAGWPTSSIENLYQYKEYPEDDCAWLTVANYGVNIASDTQKWFTPNTIKSSAGSWDATDIFFGDDTYFGATGTSYYANWTEDYQDFYVTNCTLVKQYAYNSSSNYPLIMTIYECTENADGTLTAGTTAVQTIQSTVYSATELITSSALDASKIYKIRVYNDYSRLYEIGFQTPLTKPTLTIDPEELDFIAEPGQMQTQTFTLTGMRLTEDVTLILTDEKGVYDISVSSVSRADASAGVEVTVTFNAPEYDGSYRAQVMVSSGEASAQLGLYGSVGKPGSAYSRYLDIANYGTISTGNWYVDVIDNPYKYTENVTDQVAWLTMPVYMAREAWLYNDQNWVGNYNNYYIHVSETEGLAWDATDVFPGDDYYFTSTKSYGLGQVSTTNTDLAYTYYNVTNCTQVKAYGYNTSGTTSSYPAFIQIFELTENTDGTLTMSETRTDIQSTYTTSSDVTMTSIELDPAKIYRVYVGGARSYFYEVAFRTPLPDEKTLAELVDAGVEQQHYKIVAGDLRLVYVSGDSKKLYCKDDNQFASKSIIEEGQIDYVKTKAGLQNGDWDQSNWVVLYNSAGWSNEVVPLMGRRLKGVSGQFIDRTNPTVATSLVPQIYDETEQAVNYMENVNTYITCNFLGTTQTGSDGNTYFFVTPKPMEIAQINWAMWDEETGSFVVPPATGSSNQAHLDGGFYANDSEYDGTMPELRNGYVYNFVGMVRHEQVASSSIKAPRKAGVSNSYVVYPLSGMTDVGRVEGDVITAVSDLKAGAAVEVARYNVAGQRVDKNYRGVVIVMMSDGTSRKVVVR